MSDTQTSNDGVPLRLDECSEKTFLKDLIMTNDPNAEDCNPSDLILDSWESGKDGNHSSKFVWDTDASTNYNLNDASNESNKDINRIPMYHKSKFCTVLEEFDQEEAKKQKKRGGQNCFNCLGDHSMKDCTAKFNQDAVNKNRREFMNKRGGFNKGATRYHLAEDQLYAHMKPGKLSSELRHALNLKKNQLPKHIYMMRRLGYPPAWLEESKVSHSGMAMFDSPDGLDAKNEEIETYDIKKIIEYPGFNVEPKSNVIDESSYYSCPPMIPNQRKEMMIQYLQDLNSAKKSSTKKRIVKYDSSVIDMEADSYVTASGVKSRNSKSSSSISIVDSVAEAKERSSSPSLADLETQKQLLMKELEGGCKLLTEEVVATPEKLANLGKVNHIDLGTPILKSASPYNRIPKADNFSIGICDVINFENLPCTTGHFLRLNKVLSKMREGNPSNVDESMDEDK